MEQVGEERDPLSQLLILTFAIAIAIETFFSAVLLFLRFFVSCAGFQPGLVYVVCGCCLRYWTPRGEFFVGAFRCFYVYYLCLSSTIYYLCLSSIYYLLSTISTIYYLLSTIYFLFLFLLFLCIMTVENVSTPFNELIMITSC